VAPSPDVSKPELTEPEDAASPEHVTATQAEQPTSCGMVRSD